MSSEDRLRSHHFPPEFDMRNLDVVAQITQGNETGKNSQHNEELELENDSERGKERLKNDLIVRRIEQRNALHPTLRRNKDLKLPPPEARRTFL